MEQDSGRGDHEKSWKVLGFNLPAVEVLWKCYLCLGPAAPAAAVEQTEFADEWTVRYKGSGFI